MGGIYDRKDEEFRLIDVDGIVLASPGDFIIINEPEDFDQASIIERREENHGVDFDFFDENSALVFDKIKFDGQSLSGFDLIEQVYTLKGSDLKINLQYRHNDETNPVIYESSLVGSSRSRLDYGVSIRSRRIEFDDKFRSRQKIEYDLNRTEDLDGNAITPVVYSDIVLTPQAVIQSGFAVKGDEYDTNTPASSARFAVLNFGSEVESNLDSPINTYQTEVISFVSAITNPVQTNVLEITRFGFYTVQIEVEYRATTNVDTKLRLFVDVLNPFIQEIEYTQSIDTTDFDDGVQQTVNINASTFGMWANAGYIIRVYIAAEFDGITTISTRGSRITITGNTKSKFISTKYVPILDGISKVTEGITGESNPIISHFLSIQKAALLSGKLVRGFPETNEFKISWDSIKQSIMAVYGLGFAVIRRPSGTRVYIDQYSEFYRDEEIASYDNIAEFVIDTDKEYIANEIQVGYEKFSKGSNTVLINGGSLDFLGKYQYLTPIERDQKTLNFISKFICSGFVIEEGRQQSFGSYPDEKWTNDEDTFLIAINDGQDTIYDQIVRLQSVDLGGGNYQGILQIENYLPHILSATQITVPFVSGVPFDIEVVPAWPITPQDPIIPDEDRNITTIFVDTGNGSFPPLLSNVVFDITWTAPEADEAFDVFSGVTDSKATYNARFNLVNMLFNQSLLINSALEFKAATDKYRLTSFDNNAELETQFSIGENYSTLDPDREQITQSDDLEKQIVNQGNQLFIPETVQWEIRVPFKEMVFLKDAHEDQLPYTLTVADSTGMAIGNELHQTTGILAEGTITDIQGNDVTVDMIDGKFINGETVEDQTTAASSTISTQTSKNYGYVSSIAFDGITYKAFLKQREYELKEEMFRFMGKRKKE